MIAIGHRRAIDQSVPVTRPSDDDSALEYPKLLLAERKRQLLCLDNTQPDYATCRRSLEEAIRQLGDLVEITEHFWHLPRKER